MNILIIDKIDMKIPLGIIRSDEFWKSSANEWASLMEPYVPRDTGMLMARRNIIPKEVHYIMPYSIYVYDRPGIKISKRLNPQASQKWDKAAIKDKQDYLLVKSMQNWIDRNL